LILVRSAMILTALILSGCASSGSNPKDPWEGWNRGVYSFNKAVDSAVAKPVAKGYKAVTPDFIETGVSNVFSNLGDIPNFLNNLLQGKPVDSISDLARFVVNSTLGIAGLWDPASSMGLEKHDEDFGQTLATWGVGDGPYVMLPFIGPSTLRDTFAMPIDSETDLISEIDHIRTRNQIKLIELIDTRAGLLAYEEQLESATDEYSFVRDIYLQNRRYKVFDGNLPFDDAFECEEEDEEDCEF
jgi:phospholipid-binding lipoprotein MlaA